MSDTKETQAPLITALHDIITEDSELQEIMGGAAGVPIRLYLDMAEKDAAFPYLVHRVANEYSGLKAVARGTYYLDLWDYSQMQLRTLKMRGRLLILLDQLSFTVGDDICLARMWLQTDGTIPEDTEGIQHRAMQFNLRYDRKVEIRHILGRG